MASDEYVEPQAARDALQALIRIAVCEGVKDALQRERQPDRVEWAKKHADNLRRRADWVRIPAVERDRLALDAFGADRLIIRELTRRLEARFPDVSLYESDVRASVRRLLARGELTREPERYRKGDSIRYRYYRSTDLSGSIADLDRIFNEEED